ncbi:hypothetical protein E3N88_31639 [Mikania micrantha]|uniref:Retrovirus-related Pol polyprotein from transposon TNT 1-94-like beta-barrel domain-containing protein n=1 Tax=Mikania micrantha TaxID=192012 RepID=A0A5N6M696_9ASTR|nr:hypothetical protein E3N88_31639 [Mikania micrantha]
MADLQVVGGVKKLNSQNYNSWSTCISSYLQSQDLWEVVNGSETVQPIAEDVNGVLRKWRIKAGKAMFVLKTTVEDDLLDHISTSISPKEAWDVLVELFSKKNDAKLQLLENELLSMNQREMMVSQYFHKAEFRSFVAAVQGWPTQPSLSEFENLLASQEALAKQMSNMAVGSTAKVETEALFAERSKGKFRQNKFHRSSPRYHDKNKGHDPNEKRNGETEKGESSNERKHKYNGKNELLPDTEQLKEELQTSEVSLRLNDEELLVEEANCSNSSHAEEDFAYVSTIEARKNKLDDWIMDSGCSNHMTGDKTRLKNPTKYGGSRVVVIADNSKHSIAHIGDAEFPANDQTRGLTLKDAYDVPGMKNNLISVPQMTADGHYVVFGPKDVKIYREFESSSTPILQGCQYGKASQLPYNRSEYHANKPFELVHSNVFGPVKQASIGGPTEIMWVQQGQ